jgi:hypothetical protein
MVPAASSQGTGWIALRYNLLIYFPRAFIDTRSFAAQVVNLMPRLLSYCSTVKLALDCQAKA